MLSSLKHTENMGLIILKELKSLGGNSLLSTNYQRGLN